MMKYADSQGSDFCIAWLEDGKSFVINDPDAFTRQVVPKFFKQTKFTSFTRKLYRWGFRQVNRGIGPDDPIIFGNEFFQRNNAELMARMRSTTAASTRKQQEMVTPNPFGAGGMKRPFDQPMDESSQKRMMFDQYFQGKTGGFLPGQGFNSYMPGPGEPMSLTNALYPGMMMGMGQGMMNMGGNNNGNKMTNGNFQGNNNGMMMNQYMPQGQPGHNGNNLRPPQMQPAPHNQQQQQGGQYGNQNSTAEIVNAAISALRYAN